jgi:hypothetical protein
MRNHITPRWHRPHDGPEATPGTGRDDSDWWPLYAGRCHHGGQHRHRHGQVSGR